MSPLTLMGLGVLSFLAGTIGGVYVAQSDDVRLWQVSVAALSYIAGLLGLAAIIIGFVLGLAGTVEV